MKSKNALGKVQYEYFGSTVYVTFINYKTGEEYSRFYKTESAAKTAVTKFGKKLTREALQIH